MVVVIPSVSVVEDRWEEALSGYRSANSVQWDFGRPTALIQAVGRQWNFDVLDLLGTFRADFRATHQSSSWPHDGHWNERGHRLAANEVAAFLSEHAVRYGLN